MPRLIDIHSHLQFASFQKDYQLAIRRALEKDIWIIISGTQKNTSIKAVEIAEGEKEGVYATIGLHPIHTEENFYDSQEFGESSLGHQLKTTGEEFDDEFYRNLAKHHKVVGIGECGLDYYRLDVKTKLKQKKALLKQIQLAYEVNKPLIFHCRSGEFKQESLVEKTSHNAYSDLIEIILNNRSLLKNMPGVIHFFSGKIKDASQLLDLGFYFSFGGVITFAEKYREIVDYVPLNRILLETDAPYVSPVPYRGERNEPLYLIQVAKKIAEIKGVEIEEVEQATTRNARNLFGL